MENFGCLYVSFSDQQKLKRFCWYMDAETRPDFDDEVPDSESELFQIVELLELPESKSVATNNGVIYGFEMLSEPENEYQTLAKFAKRLGSQTFISYWFGEYDENELLVYHNEKLTSYNKNNQPFDKKADFDDMSSEQIVKLVLSKL
ncbi:hypothetical protein [Catenovulum sediminis]|uniref:Uncharacterized protein n=1 Tax=Catenovulum sediminis TaxID=1740262 RepID=A0ABV1RBL2_9ALTE